MTSVRPFYALEMTAPQPWPKYVPCAFLSSSKDNSCAYRPAQYKNSPTRSTTCGGTHALKHFLVLQLSQLVTLAGYIVCRALSFQGRVALAEITGEHRETTQNTARVQIRATTAVVELLMALVEKSGHVNTGNNKNNKTRLQEQRPDIGAPAFQGERGDGSARGVGTFRK